MKAENIIILYNNIPLSCQKILLLSIQNSEPAGKRYVGKVLALNIRKILNYKSNSNSIYKNLLNMQQKLTFASFLIKTEEGYLIEKPLYRKINYNNGLFSFEFSKESKSYLRLMKEKISEYDFDSLMDCKKKNTLKLYEIIFNKLKSHGKYVSDYHLSTHLEIEELRTLLKESEYRKQKINNKEGTEIEVLNLEQPIKKHYPKNIEFYDKIIHTSLIEMENKLERNFQVKKIFNGRNHSLYSIKITVNQNYSSNPKNSLSIEDYFEQTLEIKKKIPIIFTDMELKKLFMEANYNKELILSSFEELSVTEKYDVQAYHYLLNKVKETRMRNN